MRRRREDTSDRRRELAVYLAVAFVLVVSGALWRTIVLNWIVGPVAVVIGVTVLSAALEHGRSHR